MERKTCEREEREITEVVVYPKAKAKEVEVLRRLRARAGSRGEAAVYDDVEDLISDLYKVRDTLYNKLHEGHDNVRNGRVRGRAR